MFKWKVTDGLVAGKKRMPAIFIRFIFKYVDITRLESATITIVTKDMRQESLDPQMET